eukprot:COSAG01_NODE_7546_length_3157_cov_3.524853_2_plen_164_part_00
MYTYVYFAWKTITQWDAAGRQGGAADAAGRRGGAADAAGQRGRAADATRQQMLPGGRAGRRMLPGGGARRQMPPLTQFSADLTGSGSSVCAVCTVPPFHRKPLHLTSMPHRPHLHTNTIAARRRRLVGLRKTSPKAASSYPWYRRFCVGAGSTCIATVATHTH